MRDQFTEYRGHTFGFENGQRAQIDESPDPSEQAMLNEEAELQDTDADALADLLSHSPMAMEVLSRVCDFIFPTERLGVKELRAGFIRLIVLVGHLRPDVGGVEYSKIAERLGVSRATLSFANCRLRDVIGDATVTHMPSAARKVFRARAFRVWSQRKEADAASA